MKKILFIFLAFILLVSACVPQPVNENGYAQSDLQREENPQVDLSQLQALVDGNTRFALDFYRQINSGNDNLIFSPISLSLALSMTLSGARGATREEMLQALSLESLGDDLHPAFNALLLAIEASEGSKPPADETGSPFKLNIANAIWGQVGADFEQDFLDGLALNYGAGIYEADYAQDVAAARQTINEWIANETEQKIPKLIPDDVLDATTRLVLANAIYFKGSWAYPFSEGGTRKAPFTLLDGSVVDVDTMTLSNAMLPYTQQDGFQAVALPYLSHDFSMLLILPDAGKFTEIEAGLSAERLQAAVDALETTQLALLMPKFDFETGVDAIPPLQSLGMLSAFGNADFSGISKSMGLFISDVLHKATITVDEKGTEAAAATMVAMQESVPGKLVIDRPFLFAIRHEPSGSILFMGRVLKP